MKENTSSQISLSSKKASKTKTKAKTFFSFKVKAKKFKLKRNKISFKPVSGLQHCEVENTYNYKNVRESIKNLEKVCYIDYFLKVGKIETDEKVSYKLEVELSVIWKK